MKLPPISPYLTARVRALRGSRVVRGLARQSIRVKEIIRLVVNPLKFNSKQAKIIAEFQKALQVLINYLIGFLRVFVGVYFYLRYISNTFVGICILYTFVMGL